MSAEVEGGVVAVLACVEGEVWHKGFVGLVAAVVGPVAVDGGGGVGGGARVVAHDAEDVVWVLVQVAAGLPGGAEPVVVCCAVGFRFDDHVIALTHGDDDLIVSFISKSTKPITTMSWERRDVHYPSHKERGARNHWQ